MTGHPATGMLDGQRHAWQVAAELVEKTDTGTEQVLRMMAADVGETPSEVVYEENKLELHRYEPETVEHETPILFVYALVNRPYILDLQPDKSVIRHLMDEGFEVYLIDWGEPSIHDRTLTLEDYVCRYMDNCIDAVCAESGVDDVHLVGYCMGGSMSIMYTALDDSKVRTLGLMATPLAFDETGGVLERWASFYDPDVAVDTLGNMPAELLAWEFSMMEPVENYVTKYVRLYDNIENDAFVENFARMEQWIWDGVDVAGETFREFINVVYKQNQLINSEFHLGDERVDLAEIDLPVIQIVGKYDHIVPPASSTPFHDEISSADDRLIEFDAGHIGISVSSKAHDRLWPEVADWFAARSPRGEHPDLTVREPDDAPVAEGGTEADAASASEADAASASEADAASASEADAGTAAETTDSDAQTGAASVAVAPDDEETVEAAATVENVSAAAEAAVQSAVTDASAEATGPATGSNGHSETVESVDGIGPTYAERLQAAGIETRDDLADYDAAELAAIADTYPGRAADWLEQVA